MKIFLLFVVSSITVFLITLYFRLGGNKSVDIELENHPGLAVIFREHIGPYHEIVDTINSVEAWAIKKNIPCTKTFGEYLDDPRRVEERRLRSHGGCVLSAPIPDFKEQFLQPGTDDAGGVQVSYSEIPARKTVVAHFEGAPSIGPFKVYPRVESYLEERRLKQVGAVIEIYTIKAEGRLSTEYLFPVSE